MRATLPSLIHLRELAVLVTARRLWFMAQRW